MYLSLQTVCGCHGYLLFESIHCDRCRSLIPYQISDESLIEPVSTNNMINNANIKAIQSSKQTSDMLVAYHQKHKRQQQQQITTGRIRFRALCPFCNSPTYVLRYYCQRERLYYHLRIQSFAENEQSVYKSIVESQRMNNHEQYSSRRNRQDSLVNESIDDSYTLSESTHNRPASTILYDQSGIPNARDIQNENEKRLYALNDLEGDLFNVLRNGLYYDTIIQCQDDVKLQVHRCILGGRSPWFRHLLNEYHDSDTQDDYVLQISIDDIQSDVMNEILNFLYTNRCLISLKNAPDLLIAAKRFEIEKLRKQIADFLLSRLTVDNAIEMLICAHEAGSESLKSASIRLINRNAEKIKRTEKWRKFKTQYVDLVPELYESRIERLVSVPTTFLPDVFSGPTVPSESLQTLSKLYENPVKQRLASTTVRTLPTTSKSHRSRSPTPVVQLHQQIESQEPIRFEKTGSFAQHNDRMLPLVADRASPLRKPIMNKTRRRPIPTPAISPGPRISFTSAKQHSDIDPYRRPANRTEKSVILPTNIQKKPTVPGHVPQKPPPPTQPRPPATVPQKPVHVVQQKPPPLVSQKPTHSIQQKPPATLVQKSPSPTPEKTPPPPPTKVSRGVSPRYIIEIRESPTLTDVAPEEQFMLARVMSVDPMD